MMIAKTALPMLAAFFLLSRGLIAQNVSAPTDDVAGNKTEDPIESAIRAFNHRERSKPNEVIVVLEPEKPQQTESAKPSHPPQDPKQPPAEATPSDAEHSTPKVVLVTGKPPKDSQVIDISEIPVVSDPESSPAPEDVQPKPKQGLEVRVQNVQPGNGEIDTKHVRLLTPFPAKPLNPAPAGWLLKVSDEAPPFTREVELAPGKKITLNIHPHLLVPDANGANVFAVPEPGFNASLGLDQSDTVAAALTHSIHKLDEDSKQLGILIDRLQQLMVSLPNTESAPSKIVKDPARPKP